MRLPDKLTVIENRAVGGGILDKRAKNGVVEFELRKIADPDLDAERLRAGVNDFNGLRMAIVCDEKHFSIGNDRMTKRHRFGGGGGFIEKRRVRDIERGKIGNHRLKIKQRFESALREFGLIRRVGGVPAGIFQNVSLNDWRRDAIGITGADERARRPYSFSKSRAVRPALRSPILLPANLMADSAGYFSESPPRSSDRDFRTDIVEHLRHFRFVRPDVTSREGIEISFVFAHLHLRRLRKAKNASSLPVTRKLSGATIVGTPRSLPPLL